MRDRVVKVLEDRYKQAVKGFLSVDNSHSDF